MSGKTAFSSEAVHSFVDELFGEDLHAKRVTSLAKATVGTLQASSLAVSAIGHGLALAQGGLSRHAIKQVDRMLSNDGIDVDALMADWAGYCLGSRTEIVVAMDWTDFDADGHSTLMLSLLTEHGRATPLLWLTVRKTELKERRNHYEYWIVTRLAELFADRSDGAARRRSRLLRRQALRCPYGRAALRLCHPLSWQYQVDGRW